MWCEFKSLVSSKDIWKGRGYKGCLNKYGKWMTILNHAGSLRDITELCNVYYF